MLQPDVNSKDDIRGNAAAAVTLVEYGDYQCPHCAHAHPEVQKLLKHYGDKVAFVFRNFPINDSHPMAFAAAVTAEAAGKKDLFWQTHDAIFEQQDKLDAGDDGLLAIAGSVGLDAAFVQAGLDDKALQQKVSDDFESGIESGVGGTPTFFINGRKYADMPEYAEMRAEIDRVVA